MVKIELIAVCKHCNSNADQRNFIAAKVFKSWPAPACRLLYSCYPQTIVLFTGKIDAVIPPRAKESVSETANMRLSPRKDLVINFSQILKQQYKLVLLV